MHSRRALRSHRLTSQARGSGACYGCRNFAGGSEGSIYGAPIGDTLVDPSDRICGKRLRGTISDVAAFAEAAWSAQARPGRSLVPGVSATSIDRLLVDRKLPRPAISAGGLSSTRRRGLKCRSGRSNDWHDPPPGFCEADMVAHGGTSAAGSSIQTLTMIDVATVGPNACRW